MADHQPTMKKTIYWFGLFFCVGILLLFLFPTRVINANASPPSLMIFNMIYHVKDISILDGKLLVCSDEQCLVYTEYTGDFRCSTYDDKDTCFAGKYDPDYGEIAKYIEEYPSGYHKLVITFSDLIRESNVFYFSETSQTYKVQVNENDLVVQKDRYAGVFSPFGILFLFIFGIFTLIIEGIVSAIYLKITKKSLEFIPYVWFANLISYPIVWLGIRPYIEQALLSLIIVEITAIILETVLLTIFGKNKQISFMNALVLSIVNNIASFVIPLYLAMRL